MKKKTPKILLSAKGNKEIYMEAVKRAGGIPVAEYCPQYSEEYDGLILCGGADVEPSHYGQPMNGSVDPDEDRDAAEWKLLDAFTRAKKPIFGICRGFQVLNIWYGGTLHQDIPTKARHRADPKLPYLLHEVVTDDPLLEGFYGSKFVVNSCHHQAVDKFPDRYLRATAISPEDGLIEALAHKTLPIFGVQWHPEKLTGDWQRPGAVDGIELFEYFIGLCKEKRR